MNLKCKNCGSEKMMKDMRVVDQGHYSDGTLKVHAGNLTPESFWFKSAVFNKLTANICGDCGYTALFVEDPAGMYSLYLKQKGGDS